MSLDLAEFDAETGTMITEVVRGNFDRARRLNDRLYLQLFEEYLMASGTSDKINYGMRLRKIAILGETISRHIQLNPQVGGN